MTDLWILIGLLWVLATLVLWWHYFKANKPVQLTSGMRKEANIALYNEQLSALKEDLSEGSIDEESFEQLKVELDKTLLQDVNADNEEQAVNKKVSILWPAALTLFVLGFSTIFYLSQPSYQQLEQAMSGQGIQPAHTNEQQQEVDKLRQLEQIVAQDPENSRAWYTLGQSYVMIGNYDKALAAYDKVIDLEGEIADLFGSKAQTLYYKNGQKITPEVQSMMDKALSLDPLDSSTLVLLGMHNYLQQDFAKAIEYWQKVVDSNRPNVNREALMQAINEAKSLLSGNPAQVAAPVEPTVVEGPKITLDISLAESVMDALSSGEDKVVFIYATPATGARMPLAAVKMMASDFPAQIVLSNANAMSPQANLSSSERVNVYAVLSHDGAVGIKPGDYIAELLDIANSSEDTIKLTIEKRVE